MQQKELQLLRDEMSRQINEMEISNKAAIDQNAHLERERHTNELVKVLRTIEESITRITSKPIKVQGTYVQHGVRKAFELNRRLSFFVSLWTDNGHHHEDIEHYKGLFRREVFEQLIYVNDLINYFSSTYPVERSPQIQHYIRTFTPFVQTCHSLGFKLHSTSFIWPPRQTYAAPYSDIKTRQEC